MKPVSCGYSAVNDVKLYHEIYGEGEPLVLIHGGQIYVPNYNGGVDVYRVTP